ncbi:meiosis inhibitor protein 1 isoform X2 [Syngnathoides biaculeatus]|uniref:meiosis inhibitor protein 1 isoform X2 n=1 Tax=Syngnathoides biaculeatus TaxID=300417 RepID=UPI002ADE6678|nr:meiosis inhibitor protein 1 isoform X2 [Syngnathoides biaculeatus]
MASEEIIYDKIHFRHDTKWSGRLGPAEGRGLFLCVACVIEMLESDDISSVRKSYALSAVSGVLKCSPGALRELLQQDSQVWMHFIASLLGMLHIMVDPATLEKVDQVLVLLLLELQSELPLHYVLEHINKQVIDQLNVKDILPTFNVLGSLVEKIPTVALILVTQYVPLLELLCSVLLYPDEGVQASVVYVWLKLLGASGGSAAQSLPDTIRNRVCVLLLQTFSNASCPQLINNCIALLWLLVQWPEAVSVLMSNVGDQFLCTQNQNIHISSSQSLSQTQEQQTPDHCHLPLILKKLLLSGDVTLQVTSAKCIASILVHSPIRYSAPFIKADIPEFLFDRLANTSSEVLLWSVYSCLVLLIEDPLFFSLCHSVYGIESLVRSLKQGLQLANVDVLKQGLLLLTEILERQPTNVHLFLSPPAFMAVSEAVICGLSSPCLRVATQAASAASTLFRLNHQSRPVLYQELQGIVKAITNRFSELPIPSSNNRQSRVSLKKPEQNSLHTRSEGFLLHSLLCFQAACRLAEECASDPILKENTFTAPSKISNGPDSLESLRQYLLQCCDSVWIPTVVKICEFAPNPQILQVFYSILSSQFTLLPSVMPAFANKMASSGFYRLALEHKGIFCVGNRNTHLNAACCDFLQKLSMCLLSQSVSASGIYQQDSEEIENLLLHNLSSLCCRLSNWPTLLFESPGLQLCDYKGPRATQYCLLIILHLALQQGDRLLPDQTVFSSVVWLLRSVQEEGTGTIPTLVLRASIYLLAVTHDKSTTLEGAPLDCINKALSSCQSFSSLYIHHPAILHFICGHPLLKEKFGALVLELWLTNQAQSTDTETTMEMRCSVEGQEQGRPTEIVELLSLVKKYQSVILILLDIVCTREASLAERAMSVLMILLDGHSDFEADMCSSLKPALLQALQRLSVENIAHVHGQKLVEEVNSLPLVLRLLCVTHTSNPPSPLCSKMDEIHFKLLYHVSHIAGRLNQSNTESLLPALNYLYCCLSLSPAHCADRAVSMLLSNCGLLEQLQTILSSSSSSSISSASFVFCSTDPSSALLCCSHLLLSSLITLQREHSMQVHKRLTWSLETAVQRILIQKRNTDTLLLASYVVRQPWSRFFISFLHSSGESFLLHPAILRVITLVRC